MSVKLFLSDLEKAPESLASVKPLIASSLRGLAEDCDGTVVENRKGEEREPEGDGRHPAAWSLPIFVIFM